MTGEARELGDDPFLWRDHWLSRMAGLVDASLGHFGEMEIAPGCRPIDVGVALWGHQERFVDPEVIGRALADFRDDPNVFACMRDYLLIRRANDGVCLSRRDFIEDRDWYRSADYQVVQRSFGVDPVLFCFRSISGPGAEELSGIVLNRAKGMREYDDRERAVVREAHDALAPLIGRALASFREPSPMDLALRARQVLACLLEGDSDKQVAVRLGLSPHTVNQYAKTIFRHFGVESRPRLLARWARRGWGLRFAWNEAIDGPFHETRNDRAGARPAGPSDPDGEPRSSRHIC